MVFWEHYEGISQPLARLQFSIITLDNRRESTSDSLPHSDKERRNPPQQMWIDSCKHMRLNTNEKPDPQKGAFDWKSIFTFTAILGHLCVAHGSCVWIVSSWASFPADFDSRCSNRNTFLLLSLLLVFSHFSVEYIIGCTWKTDFLAVTFYWLAQHGDPNRVKLVLCFSLCMKMNDFYWVLTVLLISHWSWAVNNILSWNESKRSEHSLLAFNIPSMYFKVFGLGLIVLIY